MDPRRETASRFTLNTSTDSCYFNLANLSSKVKEAADDVYESKAAGKANELRGEAKGKAEELKGKAKGAAAEAKGEVKNKLS